MKNNPEGPDMISSVIGDKFYSGNEKYLGMANGEKYEIASNLSEFSTYSGLIFSIGSNIPVFGGPSSFFSDIATITGSVTTYIASYPIGRQDFEDAIMYKLANNITTDDSITLHRWSSTAKWKEKFECELWKGDYISRYTPLSKLSDIVIRTDFKSM
ncbi:MAG: hypothetical protein Q4F95_09325 [Oscillospiraceae bacterium]|nr:hypothetical protein [Oscillospiraceae bacterium]